MNGFEGVYKHPTNIENTQILIKKELQVSKEFFYLSDSNQLNVSTRNNGLRKLR